LFLIPEFVKRIKIEHINLFKLLSFLEKSKLSNKLQGFSSKQIQASALVENGAKNYIPRHESPLRQISTLLACFAFPDADGRIILSSDENGFSIKYILMNPENVFRGIVLESRSVILAGGTMSPMDDFVAQLFSYLPAEKILRFECGHVISNNHLLPLVIGTTQGGEELSFSFNERTKTSNIHNAGTIIIHLSSIVPDGIVVFCPSYQYLNTLSNEWGKSGIFKKIEAVKNIFMERASDSDQIDILGLFSEAIKSKAKVMRGLMK
jgi:chromosome transmission fidelity protein 1